MEQENTVLTYNGEIYNYRQLKEKFFNKRTQFYSRSDSEVLLKLWNLRHEKALSELDGMFAFAIFKNKKLSLAVDPFGEKPLYYFQDNNGVYFSSEIDSLGAICDFGIRSDEEFISEFLFFEFF